MESVPGACALIAGLTASGLATDRFIFLGFLPHKSGQRRKVLNQFVSIDASLVLYESPFRIEKLIDELLDIVPTRSIVLARELTKKFEEYVRGTPAELKLRFAERKLKGEFVVIIASENAQEKSASKPEESASS